MVFGSYLVEIESRLLQLFPPGRTVPMSGRDDPFVVITAVMAEYSSMMEYERRRLDFSVRDQESKTGVTAHFYDESSGPHKRAQWAGPWAGPGRPEARSPAQKPMWRAPRPNVV
jgi:hypothetical protein